MNDTNITRIEWSRSRTGRTYHRWIVDADGSMHATRTAAESHNIDLLIARIDEAMSA